MYYITIYVLIYISIYWIWNNAWHCMSFFNYPCAVFIC